MSIIWENYSYNDLTADIVPIAESVQSLAVVTVEELECQVRERVLRHISRTSPMADESRFHCACSWRRDFTPSGVKDLRERDKMRVGSGTNISVTRQVD